MSDKYAVNTEVEWEWGSGTGQGKVRKVFTERVSPTIKGSEITRNATEDDPAYLIEQGRRAPGAEIALRAARGRCFVRLPYCSGISTICDPTEDLFGLAR